MNKKRQSPKNVKFKGKSEVKVIYLLFNQSDERRRRWLKLSHFGVLSLNFSSSVFRRNSVSIVVKYKSFPILHSFSFIYRSEFADNIGSETHVLTKTRSCDGSLSFFSPFIWQNKS